MNILTKSLVALMLLISLFSCKRNLKEGSVISPTNIAASSSFAITDAFALGSNAVAPGMAQFYATATFNETVSWKIVLTGLSSGATKLLQGTSSYLDQSNTAWNINHDGTYFFENNETVKVDLIITGKQGIYATTTCTLFGVPDISPSSTFQLVNPYSNFESGVFGGGGAQWYQQINVGGTVVIKQQDSKIAAPEGQYYLHIEGVSKDPNGFFVGGLQQRAAADASKYFLPTSWTDPEKLYVNIYIRGMDQLPQGYKPYATLNFECHEDDNLNASTTANCTYYANKPAGTGTDHFCPSSEDAWVYAVLIRHTGWQLFSCKYSDMYPSADISNGGSGNRKLEPQKICRVQLGLLSSPPFNLVEADVDFACFTYGAPLDPTKF